MGKSALTLILEGGVGAVPVTGSLVEPHVEVDGVIGEVEIPGVIVTDPVTRRLYDIMMLEGVKVRKMVLEWQDELPASRGSESYKKLEEIMMAKAEHDAIAKIFWAKVRQDPRVANLGAIEIRKGWKIVTVQNPIRTCFEALLIGVRGLGL